MKIKIKNIVYRVIPFVVAFVVVASSAVSANASADFDIVDYNDYITNTEIDGDNDIVTVTFPLEICGIVTKDMYGSRRWPNQRLQSIYLNYSTKNGSCGFYVPGSGITTTWIDLTNIPEGSEFSFSGDVLVADENYYGIDCTAWVGMQYYDVNGHNVGSQNVDKVKFQFSGDGHDLEKFYTYSDSIAIKKPVNAVYGCFMVMVQVSADVQTNDSYASVYFDFRLPTLKMSISSMYRLQQETGKTNKLLESLIDGTPEQGEAVGGAVDDMQNASDKLAGIGGQLAGVDKPEVDSIDVSVNSLVPYNAMLAYVAPIQSLWDNTTLLGMLSIVIALVIVSWVFFGKKV